MSKNHVAVLSMGSSKLTIAVGARGVNNTFHVKSIGQAVYDGYSDGELISPEDFFGALADAFSQADSGGIQIDRIYVGVPTDFARCVVRDVSVSFPKVRTIKPIDIENLYQTGNIYKSNKEYTVINRSAIYFQTDERRYIDVLGAKTNKLAAKVSYVLADNNFLKLIDQCFAQLGVSDVRYLSSALSTYLYLFSNKTRNNTVYIADVGNIASSVVCAHGLGLMSMRSFAGGGGMISLDLSQELNIPYDKAERLKHQVVLTLEPEQHERYIIDDTTAVSATHAAEVMTESLYNIAEMISRGVEQSGVEDDGSATLYLTGGGISYIRGAKDVLERVVGKDVEIIAPPLPLNDKPELSELFGLMDTALGQENQTKRRLFN